MLDLDIKLVRYFVTVAHTLHFTRAAGLLYISQPALSQAIAKLEKTLGVPLLTRDNRSVELTPMGMEFLVKAEDLLECADAAVSLIRQVRRGQENLLRIGFIPAPGDSMSRIIAAAEERTPSLTVQTRRLEWRSQETAVVEGEVDVSFARAPLIAPELDHITVGREGRVVCVSDQHPLAGRESVSINELADQPVISSSTCPSEAWKEFWAVSPRPDGSTVRWGPVVDTVEELLEMASRGHGVCITAESVARHYPIESISVIPITDIPDSTVELCWHRANPMPTIALLRDAARSFVETDSSIRSSYSDPTNANRESLMNT